MEFSLPTAIAISLGIGVVQILVAVPSVVLLKLMDETGFFYHLKNRLGMC